MRLSMSLRRSSVHNFGEPMVTFHCLCETVRSISPSECDMTDTILYQHSGHVGRIVLNNPRRHNALGEEQLQTLQALLTQIAADSRVRVLILTGNGGKTFCAGASLRELNSRLGRDESFQKMAANFAELSIPTICALNGSVFGGGVELAASCDFRIGVTGSRMRVPAAELGLCYPLSGINRFMLCVGVGAAKRMLIAAEEFDADAMLRIGFLDHLVAPPDLDKFVQDYAQRVAGLAPLAVRSMKRLLRQASSGTVDPSLALELSTLCLKSNDLQEGFAAKLQKRSPVFEGR